jgi:hypothetical protein
MILGLGWQEAILLGITLIVIVYLLWKMLVDGEELGVLFAKLVKKTNVTLIEIALGFANFVEAMIAKHITDALEGDFSIPGTLRLFLHLTISSISFVVSLSLYDQFYQAIEATFNLRNLVANRDRLTPEYALKIFGDIFKEWLEFFVTLILAIGGPIANLLFVAYTCDDLYDLWVGNWQDLELATANSTLITVFHFGAIAFLMIRTSERRNAKLRTPKGHFNANLEDVAKFLAKNTQLMAYEELLNKLRGHPNKRRVEYQLRKYYNKGIIQTKIADNAEWYDDSEVEAAIDTLDAVINEAKSYITQTL